MDRWSAIVAALLILGTISLGGAVVTGAESDFSLEVSPSVDTPKRTVDFKGDTYDVEDIARVEGGEKITATVDTPSDDNYRVYIYNSDGDTMDQQRLTGDDTAEFSMPDSVYTDGTYVAAVQQDGEFKVVHTVVVAGYETSVTAPEKSTVGERVSVSADVNDVSGEKPIDKVRLVVANADQDVRRTMSKESESDGSYTTTLDTGSLSPGSYKLYVIVQGSETVLGRQELLDVSDSQSFTVEEKKTTTATPTTTTSTTTTTTTTTTTPTTTTTTTQQTSPGGGGGPAVTTTTTTTTRESTTTTTTTPTQRSTTTTETTTLTTTSTATTTTTGTPQTSTGTTVTSATEMTTRQSTTTTKSTMTTDTSSQSTSTSTPTIATDTESILTPDEADTSLTSTDSEGVPGFTTLSAVLALLAAGVLLIRRK